MHHHFTIMLLNFTLNSSSCLVLFYSPSYIKSVKQIQEVVASKAINLESSPSSSSQSPSSCPFIHSNPYYKMEHYKKRNNKGKKEEEDLVDDVLHCSILTVIHCIQSSTSYYSFYTKTSKSPGKRRRMRCWISLTMSMNIISFIFRFCFVFYQAIILCDMEFKEFYGIEYAISLPVLL